MNKTTKYLALTLAVLVIAGSAITYVSLQNGGGLLAWVAGGEMNWEDNSVNNTMESESEGDPTMIGDSCDTCKIKPKDVFIDGENIICSMERVKCQKAHDDLVEKCEQKCYGNCKVEGDGKCVEGDRSGLKAGGYKTHCIASVNCQEIEDEDETEKIGACCERENSLETGPYFCKNQDETTEYDCTSFSHSWKNDEPCDSCNEFDGACCSEKGDREKITKKECLDKNDPDATWKWAGAGSALKACSNITFQ